MPLIPLFVEPPPPSAYATAVLADSPLAYWRLGEASGTVAADSSGNARDGTYSGSPTLGAASLITGDTDTSVNLDGTNDHVNFGGYAAWMDTSFITLEAVIKPDTVAAQRQIMDRDGTTRIFQFRINSSSKLEFIWWTSGAGPFFATGATSLVAGTRYHVAATYDGTTGKVLLNGAVDGSGSASGTMKTGATALLIGSSVGGSYFDGPFDEPAYYGTALSTAALLDHATKAGVFGSIDLVVDAATHGHTAESVTLSQVHELAAAAATQAHTSGSPTLVQQHALVAQDATQAQAADSPALTQTNVLVVAAATQAHAADTPTLTQTHQIAVADATQAQNADSPSLTQVHAITVADAIHGHAAASVVLAVVTELAPADAAHGHTAATTTLAQQHSLTVDAASHAQSTGSPALIQVHVLSVAAAVQGQAADNAVLSTTGVLSVAAATQAQASDSPTLTQVHVLTVAAALHGQSSDGVGVSSSTNLAVADSAHAQAAAVVVLALYVVAPPVPPIRSSPANHGGTTFGAPHGGTSTITAHRAPSHNASHGAGGTSSIPAHH